MAAAGATSQHRHRLFLLQNRKILGMQAATRLRQAAIQKKLPPTLRTRHGMETSGAMVMKTQKWL
jgi:hypothetical protein